MVSISDVFKKQQTLMCPCITAPSLGHALQSYQRQMIREEHPTSLFKERYSPSSSL